MKCLRLLLICLFSKNIIATNYSDVTLNSIKKDFSILVDNLEKKGTNEDSQIRVQLSEKISRYIKLNSNNYSKKALDYYINETTDYTPLIYALSKHDYSLARSIMNFGANGNFHEKGKKSPISCLFTKEHFSKINLDATSSFMVPIIRDSDFDEIELLYAIKDLLSISLNYYYDFLSKEYLFILEYKFIKRHILPTFIKKLRLINTSNKTEHLMKNVNLFLEGNFEAALRLIETMLKENNKVKVSSINKSKNNKEQINSLKKWKNFYGFISFLLSLLFLTISYYLLSFKDIE